MPVAWKHLATLDLLSRQGHQLLRRRDLAAEQQVGSFRTRLRREDRSEVLLEGAAPLTREDPAGSSRVIKEVCDTEICGVVEIRDTGDAVRMIFEDSGEVLDVLLVGPTISGCSSDSMKAKA